MSNKIVMNLYPSLCDSLMWLKRMKYRQDKFDELINKINRIKSDEVPEAALKGIQFENCVNKLLRGEQLYSPDLGLSYQTENFTFNAGLLHKVAFKLQRHVKQQEYIQAVVPTSIGDVKIYGFVDYSFPEMDCDLKTTGKYVFGKFKENCQHGCYSLIRKHQGRPIKDFKYLVCDFKNLYVENYQVNGELHDQFNQQVVDFWEFINEHRELITDPKIFNL